ncbi:MAG: family 43 glycosylhydrolase [Candidatus Microbacterium colombiense]|nr:MAG: family 43 glycosylhydrolase [Microbacterium sp.]
MTFTLTTHWVWDFWLADDGERFHMYYLHAPKSLGDQNLRHRNATIGHATSIDLKTWANHGEVLRPGDEDGFDGSATWTGSIVRDATGLWRMYYTGSRFLSHDSHANVETIGLATSSDLHNWTKADHSVSTAAPRWYETLGSSTWPEEAWRDPWVYADPSGSGWHMLITARSNAGDERDRGVIGHAISADLDVWEAVPALSTPGSGFTHLEVPQVAEIDGRFALLFSCDTTHLAGERAGQVGGIWAVETDSPTGPFNVADAALLASDALYSGRLIQDREGSWQMLAFENSTDDGGFVGILSDPVPIRWSGSHGPLELLLPSEERA